MDNKIFVGTDFSFSASNAINVAAHLAVKLNCSLTLFHYYHIPVPVGDMPFPPVSIEEIEENTLAMLEKQKVRINSQFPTLKIETEVWQGMASIDIMGNMEKRTNVELIVLGLTGAGKASQWLFGSTSLDVARKSKVPVLIVPEDASWKPLRHVAFACDYKNIKNINGLNLLSRLVETDNGSISIIHVLEPGELPSSQEALNGIRTDHAFFSLKHSFHFIENTNVENGLDEFLKNHPSELMVMVRRNHSWFERLVSGGHTRKMPYHVQIPVLVLNEK
jgi:nucleotide-binding universal stress UspA family protein